jgi:hypothetical protein
VLWRTVLHTNCRENYSLQSKVVDIKEAVQFDGSKQSIREFPTKLGLGTRDIVEEGMDCLLEQSNNATSRTVAENQRGRASFYHLDKTKLSIITPERAVAR